VSPYDQEQFESIRKYCEILVQKMNNKTGIIQSHKSEEIKSIPRDQNVYPKKFICQQAITPLNVGPVKNHNVINKEPTIVRKKRKLVFDELTQTTSVRRATDSNFNLNGFNLKGLTNENINANKPSNSDKFNQVNKP